MQWRWRAAHDFIGYKFEVAQEIADGYDRAYQEQNNPVGKRSVRRELGAITGVNGQCQDLREGFGLTRDLFRHAWLQENRPYWLDNIMARYDLAIQLWIQRANRFSEASSQYRVTHVLPNRRRLGCLRCSLQRLPFRHLPGVKKG